MVLILAWIRRFFSRLMKMVDRASNKSRPWSRYCFSWLSTRWFLSLFFITNSKRFTTWIKWFMYMILTWIRSHFVLFPFIAISFLFFIWSDRMSNACNILNLRMNGIKTSRCIISSRTWTSIRRLRILNTRWEKDWSFVFLSKYNIILNVFAKSWFVSEVLTWSTCWIINHSLLFTLLYKRHISIITIFNFLLAWWFCLQIVKPCFRKSRCCPFNWTIMRKYILMFVDSNTSILSSYIVFYKILLINHSTWVSFMHHLSFFKLLLRYFLILNWFCYFLVIIKIFWII